MNTIEIALDVDMVVADFMGYARKFFGSQLKNGVKMPPEEWSRLSSNQHLFRDLEVMEGAYELTEWLRNYQKITDCDLYFLTALPSKNEIKFAAEDKVHWCNKYFPGIPVVIGPYSHDKQLQCTGQHCILIDDRLVNCNEWIESNGRAHQYKNWDDCKIWLEQELM
jgi:5'(3')-deoxyribonucleotidase